jgi:hypothetical protein
MRRRSTIALPGLAAILTATAFGLAGVSAAAAANVRSGISSPLRAGQRPGCRWVQGPAKTLRICDSGGKCRTQTVPPQRIWACGTVRD